ncbi:MAG: hypothetical protein AAGA35_03610 [Patescibacteria group bacterium]
MSTPRKAVQMIATLGVIGIGIYMLASYAWPNPPAVSGIGFLLAGIALWMNHCPVMKWLFERDHSHE